MNHRDELIRLGQWDPADHRDPASNLNAAWELLAKQMNQIPKPAEEHDLFLPVQLETALRREGLVYDFTPQDAARTICDVVIWVWSEAAIKQRKWAKEHS